MSELLENTEFDKFCEQRKTLVLWVRKYSLEFGLLSEFGNYINNSFAYISKIFGDTLPIVNSAMFTLSVLNEAECHLYNENAVEGTVPSDYHNAQHVFNILVGISILLCENLITRRQALILALAAIAHDGCRLSAWSLSDLPPDIRDKVNISAAVSAIATYGTMRDGQSTKRHWDNLTFAVARGFKMQAPEWSSKSITNDVVQIILASEFPYNDALPLKIVSTPENPDINLSAIFRDLDRLSSWFGQTPIETIYMGLYLESVHLAGEKYNFIDFCRRQVEFMKGFTFYSPITQNRFGKIVELATQSAEYMYSAAREDFKDVNEHHFI